MVIIGYGLVYIGGFSVIYFWAFLLMRHKDGGLERAFERGFGEEAKIGDEEKEGE